MVKYAIIIVSLFVGLVPHGAQEEEIKPRSIIILYQNYFQYFLGGKIPAKMLGLLIQYSQRYKIPLKILAGLVYNESHFNPRARHDNGFYGKIHLGIDEGLMQLNSRNYLFFRDEFNDGINYDAYNPVVNLKIGCSYMNWIMERLPTKHKNWWYVLYRYNGSGKDACDYADRIMSF